MQFSQTRPHFRKLLVYSAVLSTLTATLLLTSTARAGKPQKYDLVVVQTPGAVSGAANDVDSSGNIVGQFTDANNANSAFYYDLANDTIHTLAGGTSAVGMNDNQQIVGQNVDLNTSTTVYWSGPTAAVQALDSLAGGNAGASGISAGGIVAGTSFDDGVRSAVVWNVAGETPWAPSPLLPLEGDDHARALAVSDENDAGMVWVVGNSHPDVNSPDAGRAVRWAVWVDGNGDLQSSPAEDLGTLAGGVSTAHGVNLHGDSCGESESYFAFLKPDGFAMFELDAPRKANQARALSINTAGAAVGRVTLDSKQVLFDDRAWLWSGADSVDLNSRVMLGKSEKLERATGIGPNGHICGAGYFPSLAGGEVPFVLLP